ncbi:hypothetical protein PVAND_013926 [Polypedilum vanderplanki]|uniref:Uncharacterized protein n=1 Tax=Polypedilum vanderplanki TaxID=319348 RepID=A0A9J6CRZ9_POLVA|nr:hypothetical protein PVAND_013926 [Polypedilum vanderplanki]
MTELFSISTFLFVFIAIAQCGMIYRRYEKQHPTKNYTQIVEIFETVQRPPYYSETEKDLNDFLGRDAFKNDMNCTKMNDTEEIVTTTTKVPSTSTTRYTIPTTAYRRSIPTETTTMKSPNLDLDHLFTIKPTRTTIKPNPKENENPDYTELYNWATPHVQVTKHSPSTEKPLLIFIKETDDVQANQTTTTTTTTEATTVAEYDDNQENGYESDNETVNEEFDEDDDEYDENNYDILKDHEQMANVNYDQEDEDEMSEEFTDDLDAKKRRKRLNSIRKRRAHKRKV